MSKAMETADFEAIWERYTRTWKVTAAEEKEKEFEGCLAEGCVYSDPLAQTQGWQDLLKYMGDFHQQFPGAYFQTTYFLAHHDKSIAKWNMMSGSDEVLSNGVSYGEYDREGRLVAMTGFFEVPPS